MKKSQILAIALASSIFLSFALGCNSSSTSESTKAISTDNGAAAAETEKKETEEATTTAAAAKTPTIEEAVVYGRGGEHKHLLFTPLSHHIEQLAVTI